MVERGAAGMNAMTRERALMQSGEMRQGSNFGAGQMVASDYGMSPDIIFSNSNAGGVGAALGGLVGGRYSGVLTAVGGNMQTKEASAMLTLIDNRSGVQVAASEGSASKTDFGAFGSVFGSGARRRPGRLHQHGAGQGHRRGLHGRVQPDGHLAAQLQGADGAGPGPGRRRPAGRGWRRGAVANLGAAPPAPQEVGRQRCASRAAERELSPGIRAAHDSPG